MGRPLNKKYFGNRNIGTTGTTDNKIGGEGVASYGSYVAGSGWTTQPTASISAPNIPGGVTATGTFRYKALSFATTANGTGYAVGDILEVDTGTQTTKARAPVASILGRGTPSITNGGSLYDVTNPSVGDTVTFTHANLTTPLIVRITAVDGSTATAIAVEQQGVWNGTGAPTSMAGGVSGFTATTTARPGGDNNGTGLVLGFVSGNWGVYAFGTVSVAGSYTTFPSTAGAGTLTSVSPATGTGAKADITMGLLSVTVTEKGSGYTTSADAALVFSPAATPTDASATAVLTTDSGVVGSSTNQENAIIIRAKIDSEATTRIGDIVKQSSARRYKVKTSDGTAVCKLVATDTPATFQAYITATDDEGKNYWVTKLTAHKALLTRKDGSGGYVYATGETAPWSFTTTANGRVIIENA
jgi:hypothetical protein